MQAPVATSSKTVKPVGDTNEGHKCRVFNMTTYKLHALGDYVKAIWRYGTTDNYSTQVVSSPMGSSQAFDKTTFIGRAGTSPRQTVLLKDE